MASTASDSWLEQAYRAHGHLVLRRAGHILGDRDEAEDVLQEIFEDLARRPDQLRDRRACIAYLYRATTSRCLGRIRKRKRRQELLALAFWGRSQTAAPAGTSRAMASDVLGRLPRNLAAVAVYRFIDGMTHEQIARVLGCSRRQVGNLLEQLERKASAWRQSA